MYVIDLGNCLILAFIYSFSDLPSIYRQGAGDIPRTFFYYGRIVVDVEAY